MGWIIQTTTPQAPIVLGRVAALACVAALARAAGRHTLDANDNSLPAVASCSPVLESTS